MDFPRVVRFPVPLDKGNDCSGNEIAKVLTAIYSYPEVVLYYPRCLANKVLCGTSHIGTSVVMSLSYTYASMLHFGDEDGILYMYEDA